MSYTSDQLRRFDGIPEYGTPVNHQPSSEELLTQCQTRELGKLSDSQALIVNTGRFTGRSPRDRFIVRDTHTTERVHWNKINQPFSPENFDRLFRKVIQHLSGKETWMLDCYACADPRYQLNLRIVTESPWACLFCSNMFLRPESADLPDFQSGWLLLHAPECMADKDMDGTRQDNFVVINFSRKMILIGGTAYTGEIKKSVFTVLNYLLPVNHGILPMHCAANVGQQGDTALFFGLSGTGKTTLSTDPGRKLIGDDEHGWSTDNIFNFEGGCYAKCFNLSAEKEPQIYQAIKRGALVENVRFRPGTNQIDYTDKTITENTRVSYPLAFLENARKPSTGRIPEHIFFLCCDAYGVIPPVSRLSASQAIYQFISGYTSKIAGTEEGIKDPQATFSACYGEPFLPLSPTWYARKLGEKINTHHVNCWLINTGWTGGISGAGKRISLADTRRMVRAALTGQLNGAASVKDPVFGFDFFIRCPGVPDEILNPCISWTDELSYQSTARKLAGLFVENFKKYDGKVHLEVATAAPKPC